MYTYHPLFFLGGGGGGDWGGDWGEIGGRLGGGGWKGWGLRNFFFFPKCPQEAAWTADILEFRLT